MSAHNMPNETSRQYRPELLHAIKVLMDTYTQRHSKAMAVRFDVRYPLDYPADGTNAHMSTCMASVAKKYKRQGLDPQYIWVREQNESHHPHYHGVILLDGQKVRSYGHVHTSVEQAWSNALQCPVDGCVHHCTDPSNADANGKIMRRDSGEEKYTARRDEVFDHLKYLAKTHTKAPDNDGIRNFGMSRIPKKP